MAIRFAPIYGVANDAAAAWIAGGWATMGFDGTSANLNKQIAGLQRWQPSALSRPGNLGTAYVGVWKGW